MHFTNIFFLFMVLGSLQWLGSESRLSWLRAPALYNWAFLLSQISQSWRGAKSFMSLTSGPRYIPVLQQRNPGRLVWHQTFCRLCRIPMCTLNRVVSSNKSISSWRTTKKTKLKYNTVSTKDYMYVHKKLSCRNRPKRTKSWPFIKTN